MPQQIDTLRKWEVPGIAKFETGTSGLISLTITAPVASGRIYLQGAHITHFQPRGAAPVLFLSTKSHFSTGKAIRGGIPVIFPWFGAHCGNPTAPAHGFARNREWEIEAVDSLPSGAVTVSMILRPDDASQTQAFGHAFLLRYRVTFGEQLELHLETENTGAANFKFEEALHTYLNVSDVREVRVEGLSGAEYLDKTEGFRQKREKSERLQLTGETDRVYLDTQSECVVDDPAAERTISIAKRGSDTTVVWNPWKDKTAALNDMEADEWLRMLCIETANTGENAVTLEPGQRHVMSAAIGVGPARGR